MKTPTRSRSRMAATGKSPAAASPVSSTSAGIRRRQRRHGDAADLRARSCGTDSAEEAEAEAEKAIFSDASDAEFDAPSTPQRPHRRTDGDGDSADPEHPGDHVDGDGKLYLGRGPKSNMWALIQSELYRGYDADEEHPARDTHREASNIKVIRFMRTPRELEKFVGFGFLLCCNCFLEFFTFLPLRAIFATFQLVPTLLRFRALQSGHIRDFLQVVLIILSIVTLRYIDISFVYHLVRGEVQSVIKLYVLFNVFDIVDKLFSSFGQDILDALYLHATQRASGAGIFNTDWLGYFVLYFSFSTAYIVSHALVNLMQFITLNVAMNSANHALLTIIISAQFVELKGSVFKRSGEGNLFQISCSDARERFHILILLVLVGLKNTAQIRSQEQTQYFIDKMIPLMALVYGSEILVDWIKHSFVTRFNNINSNIYKTFTRILYKDIAKGYHHGDYSHSIVRRLGLAPIPLACLVIVAVLPASVKITESPFHWGLIWATMLCLKMSISFFLLGQASEFWEHNASRPSSASPKQEGERACGTCQAHIETDEQLTTELKLGSGRSAAVLNKLIRQNLDDLLRHRAKDACVREIREAVNVNEEYGVRYPLEKPKSAFNGKDNSRKLPLPLEDTYRYSMTSRIDQ